MFPLTNFNFLLKNVDFLLTNVDFIIKPSEMVLPSPIPEDGRRGGMPTKLLLDQSHRADAAEEREAQVAAATTRLRNRRMSVQATSMAAGGYPAPLYDPGSARSTSSLNSPPKVGEKTEVMQLRPNAYAVRMDGQGYQMEAQQPGLQLFDSTGKGMVRQFQWADIKSWYEDVDRSLVITGMDDNEFEFQTAITGPICVAMKEHTQMLLSTKQRERADHDNAIARAAASEEAASQLQGQLGTSRKDAAKATSDLQGARDEVSNLQAEMEKGDPELGAKLESTRAEVQAVTAELQAAQGSLSARNAEIESTRGEARALRAEVENLASELAALKREKQVETERISDDLASEKRSKSVVEERLLVVEGDLAKEKRAVGATEEDNQTLERRLATMKDDLEREVATMREDLTQSVEARRAAEVRGDELSREARQQAAASEDEKGSMLRAAQVTRACRLASFLLSNVYSQLVSAAHS